MILRNLDFKTLMESNQLDKVAFVINNYSNFQEYVFGNQSDVVRKLLFEFVSGMNNLDMLSQIFGSQNTKLILKDVKHLL